MARVKRTQPGRADGERKRGGKCQPGQTRLPLTVELVLVWADDHFARTGRWPGTRDRAVLASLGENWSNINGALRQGRRGLPPGGSLARLRRPRGGVRTHPTPPPLTHRLILKWAYAHHRRTGSWPSEGSGAVRDAPGEKWGNIHAALRHGRRGLPGGESLARLLVRRAGARNRLNLPSLSIWTIQMWAQDHRRRTGKWPTQYSGPVIAAPGETWSGVDTTLRRGGRGLSGGSSVARLLAEHCGRRSLSHPPPLIVTRILAWAAAHRTRTGRWPGVRAGPIPEAPGESWGAVGAALRYGQRGLRGGRSLARLLRRTDTPRTGRDAALGRA